MEMEVRSETDDITYVALTGRIDIESIGDWDQKFTELLVKRQKPAIVDLSGVEYISSIGLRMLIAAAKPLSEHNVGMILLNPKPHIEEVLRTAAFHRIMPIEHDFKKALEMTKTPVESI